MSYDDTTYYSYRPSSYSSPHPSCTSPSAGRLSHELVVGLVGLVLSSLVIVVTSIALLGRPRSSAVLYYIEGFVGDNWFLAMVIKCAGAVDWTRIGAGLAIDPDADDDEPSGQHCSFFFFLLHSQLTSADSRAHSRMVQVALPSSSGFPSAHLPIASGDPNGTHYPGLLNAAGNLCFLNATLQSIASITPLLDYLESLPSTSNSPNSVIPTLRRTLHALNSPCLMRPPPLRPSALAHALAASSPTRRRLLASCEQQDAHELLGMIREAVEEEVDKIARDARKNDSPGLGALLRFGESADQRKGRKGVHAPGKNDPWLLLTSQRVQCLTCAYTRDVRHTSDRQVELQVPDMDRCSLYQLLDEWTKLDLLSDYACRKCCLAATLTKLEEQRDRLALVDSVTTLTASTEGCTTNPSGSTSNRVVKSSDANAFEPLLDSTSSSTTIDAGRAAPAPKMTSSRANRRRKVQKLINQVKEAWDAGDYEKEFGNELKVEKVLGPAGKLTPEILTFHLSRSSHYATGGGLAVKNHCRVDFPEYLDVAPFSNDPAFTTNVPPASADVLNERPKRDLYRLASVVVHHGTHSYGHYVAFRRRPVLPPHLRQRDRTPTQEPGGRRSRASDPDPNPDPDAVEAEPNEDLDPQPKRFVGGEARAEWYHISDETVQFASIQHVLAGNPFLLFYERVKQDDDDDDDGGGGRAEGWRMQAGKGKGKKVDWKFEGMQLNEGGDGEAEAEGTRAFGEPRVLRRWELASSSLSASASRIETTGGEEGASG
ncbi:BZ3500_MvSof-1268-A1-R1_Chr5-3g08301 [Microbotryum saponariae]|uniref:ubiquitinyl hydrolase 1 n=1 Tax=Microbotryum saponariae TaxID=289078 RepID=A0A2X0KHE8_9BASI|nr:BZ3500_MvSof-1268-A1-R1_Chr5-3g08301 [Microbotryum saponariae]SDA08409.1 BZ3501_MvSof-1269-A2-R1_Chr5-3g08029 [Microbotryum saponariae]